MRVSVMLLAPSCGDPVQPPAQANEDAGGPVDVPDPVQQPPPATQRPRVGQMPDRLLHQRAQPRLHAVERPLLVAEPVFGPAVPDRRVPVRTGLGHAPKPPVQQARHAGGVQHLAQPRQLDELLLVAAARPATVAPQQVAPDGRQRQPLGGMGVPLGVVQDLLVDPAGGPLHPGAEPVDHDRLAGCGHLPKPLAQVFKGGDEPPVGLAVPEGGQLGQQQVQAVADLGLGDPHCPASPPVRQPIEDYRPNGVQADLQRQRPGAADAGWAGWQQVGQATDQVGETLAGSDERGQYDNGDRTSSAGVTTLPMVRSPHVRAQRASRTPSMKWRSEGGPDVEGELDGQVAIVTGAGRGIGRAIALELAGLGADIVAADLDQAAQTAAEVRQAGRRALSVRADVTHADDRTAMVDQALKMFGRIDVLVSNAGIFRSASPLEITEDHWDAVLNVNAKAVLFCAQAVLPTMLIARRGTIVNVASMAGKVAAPNGLPYAVSKAAVISATRSLAAAYAGDGIRVNCVCPGFVDTEMWAEIDRDVGVGRLGKRPGEFWQERIAAIPLGRAAQPEDVAGVVGFLVTAKAAYMTGQAINVTCGLVMH